MGFTAMVIEKSTKNAAQNSDAQPKCTKIKIIPKLPQRIKIFQTVQKNFDNLGICVELVSQPYLCNGRVLMGIPIIGSATISNFVYIFYEAKSFSEYTQSSYMCSACILVFIGFAIQILNAKKLFEFINTYENLINTSE